MSLTERRGSLKISVNDQFGALYFYVGLPDLTSKPVRALHPFDEILENLLHRYFTLSGEKHKFEIYECPNPTQSLINIIYAIRSILVKLDKMIIHGAETDAFDMLSYLCEEKDKIDLNDLEKLKELIGIAAMYIEVLKIERKEN